MSGSHAYIADGVAGLIVVDVTEPANPFVVGSVDTPGYTYSVAVSGNYAYVADGFIGLQVVDITTPESPFIVGAFHTDHVAYSVVATGSHAYVANGQLGMLTLPAQCDVTPVLPALLDVQIRQIGMVIDLSWTLMPGLEILRYHVYRGVYGSPGEELLQTLLPSHDAQELFADESVDPGRTYKYWIEVELLDGDVHRFGPWSISVERPSGIALLGAYPNPVMDEIQLRFRLLQTDSALLRVFGADGRLVHLQQSKTLSPGDHGFVWDGTDRLGKRASDGLYFYAITIGKRDLTGKLTILR